MTFTAVLVVFSALVLLVVIFKAIGKLFERGAKTPAKPQTASQPSPSAPASGEALVAISLALADHLGKPDEVAVAIALAMQAELDNQHDYESYKLTIQHRPTQWNARIQGTRAYKH